MSFSEAQATARPVVSAASTRKRKDPTHTVVDSLGYTVTSRNVNGQYTARLLLDDFYPMRD